MSPLHVERARGNWGWCLVLYWRRRRLVAGASYNNGANFAGRNFTLLLNLMPLAVPAFTLPFDRIAAGHVAARLRYLLPWR